MKNLLLLSVASALSLGLGACSKNYAVEGAAAGAATGALVGASTDLDDEEAAAVGAAVGAAIGYFVDKDEDCDGYDDDGELDDDCRGLPGYPPR
jgi:hypothetical protein